MARILAISVITLACCLGADAARRCGQGGTATTFNWRIGDGRYDGPDPAKKDGLSTVAFSITPSYALFECVAQWPEAWAGWYEGGQEIIWSDCIWTGNAGTADTTISFALDWKKQMMYVSHTYACSDKQGTSGLALGQVEIKMDCNKTEDSCILQPKPVTFKTTAQPARLAADAECAENSKRYQSWELDDWLRNFEMGPGSEAPGVENAPTNDTGPSFTLKSIANADQLKCAPTGKENGTFVGTCKPASGDSGTTAEFQFDPDLDMLTVTQTWNCGNSSPFNATGIGYVQAGCDRHGKQYTCTMDYPVWIGGKPA